MQHTVGSFSEFIIPYLRHEIVHLSTIDVEEATIDSSKVGVFSKKMKSRWSSAFNEAAADSSFVRMKLFRCFGKSIQHRRKARVESSDMFSFFAFTDSTISIKRISVSISIVLDPLSKPRKHRTNATGNSSGVNPPSHNT
jgi:hypothetical protein